MKFSLDNPSLIEQAKQMHACEMEALYWHLEDALYEGKMDRARGCFGILLYAAKYNSKLIVEGLKKSQRERLKEISYEVSGQSIPIKREPIIMKTGIAAVDIPFKKECELQSYLAGQPRLVSDALGEPINIVGTEVETDCDYRCDIVAESRRCCYPIELKIGQANHQVVSQCLKYCFFFYRKLRYGCFKKVQGVVIANGADDWSINELRRFGLWVYLIAPGKDYKISLRKVE